MTHLIRSDLYKLRKSRYFSLCLILSILLAAGSIFFLDAAGAIPADVTQAREISPDTLLSFFPWGTAVLTAAAVSLFVGSEFTYGTMRSMLSRNYSRSKVYLSKFIGSMLISALFSILSVVSEILSVVYLQNVPNPSVILWPDLLLENLPGIFWNGVFTAIFVLFSMLIRRSGWPFAFSICFLEAAYLILKYLPPLSLMGMLGLGISLLLLSTGAGLIIFQRCDIP